MHIHYSLNIHDIRYEMGKSLNKELLAVCLKICSTLKAELPLKETKIDYLCITCSKI